jgi:hypothetical protein
MGTHRHLVLQLVLPAQVMLPTQIMWCCQPKLCACSVRSAEHLANKMQQQ